MTFDELKTTLAGRTTGVLFVHITNTAQKAIDNLLMLNSNQLEIVLSNDCFFILAETNYRYILFHDPSGKNFIAIMSIEDEPVLVSVLEANPGKHRRLRELPDINKGKRNTARKLYVQNAERLGLPASVCQQATCSDTDTPTQKSYRVRIALKLGSNLVHEDRFEGFFLPNKLSDSDLFLKFKPWIADLKVRIPLDCDLNHIIYEITVYNYRAKKKDQPHWKVRMLYPTVEGLYSTR